MIKSLFGTAAATILTGALACGLLGASASSEPFVPAPGPTLRPAPPVDMHDLEPYGSDGDGSISGHVRLRTKLYPDLEDYEHVQVWAVPNVPYGRWLAERFHSVWFDRSNVDYPDSVSPFIHYAYTDEHGNYKIDGLQNGSYIVFTELYDVTTTGAHSTTERDPATDADGNAAVADVPALAYDGLKTETLFLSTTVTLGQGGFEFHVDEDLVSQTEHPALRAIPAQRAPVLAAQQLQAYAASGTGTIEGRLITRLQGATRNNYYGGYTVNLWPAIPYAAWLLDEQRRSWLGSRRDETDGDLPIADFANRRFFQAMRHTVTDKHGYFSFTGLPALPFVVQMDVDVARQHYLHDAPSSTTTLYDEYGNPTATFHHQDHSRNYKCDRTGLLASTVTPQPGQAVTAPMALLVTHLSQTGYNDCFMFHQD